MTEHDKAELREIAREIVAEVGPDMARRAAYHVLEQRGPEIVVLHARDVAKEAVREHAAACAVALKLQVGFWRLIAASLGSAIVGSGIMAAVVKLLS